MRGVRTVPIFVLGVWAGLVAAAVFLKRALPSVGEEDSEEVSLVAILDGRELKSRAKEFRGGTMFAWFGGIDVDLTEAELAQGARIRANTLFGGVAIKIPPGWRVQSKAKALMGGVDA